MPFGNLNHFLYSLYSALFIQIYHLPFTMDFLNMNTVMEITVTESLVHYKCFSPLNIFCCFWFVKIQ